MYIMTSICLLVVNFDVQIFPCYYMYIGLYVANAYNKLIII